MFSQSSIIDKKFLEETIKFAKRDFLTGQQNNKNLRNVVAQHSEIMRHIKLSDSVAEMLENKNIKKATLFRLMPELCIPQFKDRYFWTVDAKYNASVVDGTNFIAAAGPRKNLDIAQLFYSMVFNRTLPVPVTQFVALVRYLDTDENSCHDILGPEDSAFQFSERDCFDYISGVGNKEVVYKTDDYQIKATYFEIGESFNWPIESSIVVPVQSKVKLDYLDLVSRETKNAEITVTYYPSCIFTPEIDSFFEFSIERSDKLKQLFLNHYQ